MQAMSFLLYNMGNAEAVKLVERLLVAALLYLSAIPFGICDTNVKLASGSRFIIHV